METTGTRRISRFSGGKIEEIEDLLAMEEDFVLAANGESVFSASCSPGNSRELAYGALLSRGIIHITDDILSLKVQGERLSVEVRANVPGPVIPIDSSFTLSIESLIAVGRECGDRAVVFRGTGGTHAAALGGSAGIESLFEDISRTCALEKAVGDGFIRGIDFSKTFIFLSSRISKGMVEKVARCGIPIIAGVSAPTLQAAELAERLGVCLCGFVRGERLNIYANSWRVKHR
jgi:FdhD protein